MFLLAEAASWLPDLPTLFVVGTFWFWVLLTAEFLLLLYCLEFEKYVLAPISIGLVILALALFGDETLVTYAKYFWEHPIQSLLNIAPYLLGYAVIGTIYAIGKWWLFVREIREKNRDAKEAWTANLEGLLNSYDRVIDQYAKLLAKVQPTLQNQILHQHRYEFNQLVSSLPGYDLPNTLTANSFNEVLVRLQADRAEIAKSVKDKNISNEATYLAWKRHEDNHYSRDYFGRTCKITKPHPRSYKSRIIAWIAYWPPSLLWTIINDPVRRIAQHIYYAIAGLLSNISDHAWRDEDQWSKSFVEPQPPSKATLMVGDDDD